MPRRPAIVTQADVVATKDASVVYFVRIGKHIKIGITTDIDARIKAFQTTATFVECLLTIHGDRALEQRLHNLLAETRAARELFWPHWRLNQFIDIVPYAGLDRGLQWLEETTPANRARKKTEDYEVRIRARRQSKAELDAYYASLVAERKHRLGW